MSASSGGELVLGRRAARRGGSRRAARRDERPYAFFNFVSTLDGRAALDGSTRPLGGPADLEMLLALRAAADAVLIGPGTVRAEGYAAAGLGRTARATAPPAVLISRRFDIPWEAGLFAAAEQPVIIYASRGGRACAWRRRSRSSAWSPPPPPPPSRTCGPAACAPCQ